jgi:uncharacterized protein YeaO (DUF488 family)
VWLPALSPSPGLVKRALAAKDDRTWKTFERAYRREMAAPAPSHLIDLLAALSHQTNVAVGCYCDDETRCHRSILRGLLADRGGAVVGSTRST